MKERRRSLDTYRRKRDPARTPEPFGAPGGAAPGAARRFVIQEHAARRLHWDFRLEIDGVLASWAVPKGPSVDPKEKRLAVQTEDHPLDYGGFEGIIPAGNYGAGAVILWDRGTYETVGGEAPGAGLESGKLDLLLNGHKLRGRWALVRIKRGSGRDWLLIKKADGTPTRPEPVVARPASVVSGLTVEELRDGARRDAELAAAAAQAGAPRRALRPPTWRPCWPAPPSRPSPAPAGSSSSSTTESAPSPCAAPVARCASSRAAGATSAPASRRSPPPPHTCPATTSPSTARSSPSTRAAPAPSSACSSASD